MKIPRTEDWILLASFAISVVAGWFAFFGLDITQTINPRSIRHELGFAYVTRSAPWPLEYLDDTESQPTRSRVILFENDKPLGPAHAVHEQIRSLGSGSYSYWGGQLRFSASDNSNPLENNRTYRVRGAAFASAYSALVPLSLLILFGAPRFPSWVRLFLRIPGVRWTAINVLPGIAVSLALLLGVAIAGELFLRARIPFIKAAWPTKFDERYGFNFVPGADVQWTNNMDFWTTTRVNSLGFLDREPPKEQPAGVCRVAFVGDSFVEAAQVPIEQKIQVKLEEISKNDGTKIETAAFGYSGTGQANQLPFYDIFAKTLHPDVVVLVFVGNDFANNSSVLESVRNGWDPVHPPRLFFERDAEGAISAVPIDANWQSKIFPAEPVHESWRAWLHRTLISRSYLYNWIYVRVALSSPKLAEWIDGHVASSEVYTDRKRQIELRWGKRFDLSGWKFPNDWDMDTMFFSEKPPPVFREALTFTGHALDEFLTRARRDGFKLIILADKSMYLHSNPQAGRSSLSRDAAIERLKTLALARNIPIVDFESYLESTHRDPAKASFPHDGHWSPAGHLWAAQALYQYIHVNPSVCHKIPGEPTAITPDGGGL